MEGSHDNIGIRHRRNLKNRPIMIVYKITNKINGKAYIGQTIQKLKRRWDFHVCKRSGCLALKAAFEKYGIENFTIEIVYEASSLEELCQKEQQFIQEFNTLAPNGYNLTTGGERPVYSDESRKKMSESSKGRLVWNKGLTKDDPRVAKYVRSGKDHHYTGKSSAVKGRKHTQKANDKWKESNLKRFVKIKCVQTGQVFESINEAARVLGVRNGNITLVLQGKRSHTGGFTFTKEIE